MASRHVLNLVTRSRNASPLRSRYVNRPHAGASVLFLQQYQLSTTGGVHKPPYGYANNVNVERLRNKDKQYFTPGPLDPEIHDVKDYIIDEKRLFTLGSLNVTPAVKEAMMLDVGSRDPQFIKTVQFIRSKLLEIGGVPEDTYCAVLLSCNGQAALESVLHTTVPTQNGKVLVLENGAGGRLLAEICKRAQFDVHVVSYSEESHIDPNNVRAILERDDTFTNVVMVHCEPASGIVNPAEDIGKLLYFYSPRATFIVDGGLSFGGIPLDLEDGRIACLVGSAYHCLESVPGVSFVLCENRVLNEARGNCRSLTMDLVRTWDWQVRTGAMSDTPNTHAILALGRALIQFEEEGGVEGRARRYKKNCKVLREGMAKLGFKKYLSDEKGFMVSAFYCPRHPNFEFETFATKLYEHGVAIHQSRLANGDVFRLSTIGQINPHDVRYLLRHVDLVCQEMDVRLP